MGCDEIRWQEGCRDECMLFCNAFVRSLCRKLKKKCQLHSNAFTDLLVRVGFEVALANPGKDMRIMEAEDTLKLVHELARGDDKEPLVRES